MKLKRSTSHRSKEKTNILSFSHQHQFLLSEFIFYQNNTRNVETKRKKWLCCYGYFNKSFQGCPPSYLLLFEENRFSFCCLIFHFCFLSFKSPIWRELMAPDFLSVSFSKTIFQESFSKYVYKLYYLNRFLFRAKNIIYIKIKRENYNIKFLCSCISPTNIIRDLILSICSQMSVSK